MMLAGQPLLEAFDRFADRVKSSRQVAEAVAGSSVSPKQASLLLATYTAEARAGLELVSPLLREGMRVLEVGSGIGVLTRFLHDQGVDITGIEPAASGFSFMHRIGAAVFELGESGSKVKWLPIGAQALDPAAHGAFDLIFSTNVLEHMNDLEGSFRGMTAVLKPQGRMIHHCPNYFLPYEPHFGIPLIPIFPGLTRVFCPKTLQRYPGLWDDFNFITAGRVRRLGARLGLKVRFERGVLAKMLRRFNEDEVFRNRQGGPAALVTRAIAFLGVERLAEYIPGEYLSPMVMELTHAAKPTGAHADRVGP
jgi:2-polyprenyl-3-methyl-5-hydroxy-6-metoxy-1,4-benzoquinol methylase